MDPIRLTPVQHQTLALLTIDAIDRNRQKLSYLATKPDEMVNCISRAVIPALGSQFAALKEAPQPYIRQLVESDPLVSIAFNRLKTPLQERVWKECYCADVMIRIRQIAMQTYCGWDPAVLSCRLYTQLTIADPMWELSVRDIWTHLTVEEKCSHNPPCSQIFEAMQPERAENNPPPNDAGLCKALEDGMRMTRQLIRSPWLTADAKAQLLSRTVSHMAYTKATEALTRRVTDHIHGFHACDCNRRYQGHIGAAPAARELAEVAAEKLESEFGIQLPPPLEYLNTSAATDLDTLYPLPHPIPVDPRTGQPIGYTREQYAQITGWK